MTLASSIAAEAGRSGSSCSPSGTSSGCTGRASPGPRWRRAVHQTFASYTRYWVDSFRLPKLSAAEIDAGFAVEGYDHIARAVAAGTGPILALPHLGGWEWAAFWLTRVLGERVTAVVEAVEPPELFEFFVTFRRQLGMDVVPLGPSAGSQVLSGIRSVHVVCLLSDRDIAGDGIEVDFFGEKTTLPPGPVTVALRTGAPLIPTCGVLPRLGPPRRGGSAARPDPPGALHDDVTPADPGARGPPGGADPACPRAVAPPVAQLAQRLRRAGGHRPSPSPTGQNPSRSTPEAPTGAHHHHAHCPRSNGCPRSSCTVTSKGPCDPRRCWSWPPATASPCRPPTSPSCTATARWTSSSPCSGWSKSCLVQRRDWARLAYESVIDAAAHGRVYAETFFTPARHLAAGAFAR